MKVKVTGTFSKIFLQGESHEIKTADCKFKEDALNRVIVLNTHLYDAHIDMDRLKFVLFCIYNHVQMCRKQN